MSRKSSPCYYIICHILATMRAFQRIVAGDHRISWCIALAPSANSESNSVLFETGHAKHLTTAIEGNDSFLIFTKLAFARCGDGWTWVIWYTIYFVAFQWGHTAFIDLLEEIIILACHSIKKCFGINHTTLQILICIKDEIVSLLFPIWNGKNFLWFLCFRFLTK